MIVALRAVGATVTDLSLTAIESLDTGPIHDAVLRLDQYAWLVLASAPAVTSLELALDATGALLGARKLAVVGDATLDAVEAMGWPVTTSPERSGVDGLLDVLATRGDVDGTRVLYPAAEGVRDVLPSGLRSLGATVDVVPVFRTVPDLAARARLLAMVANEAFDLVTVSAPGTLDALLEAIPPEHVGRIPVACVGPVAARAARKAGFPVKVEAEHPSPATMVRRIVAAFQSSR